MEADKRILLLAQKSAETDDPHAADLYQVGTLAQVLQLLKLPDGTVKVLVEGLSRVQVTHVDERDGSLLAGGGDRRHRRARSARSRRSPAR
jgi:ATP-dependent Lon protease